MTKKRDTEESHWTGTLTTESILVYGVQMYAVTEPYYPPYISSTNYPLLDLAEVYRRLDSIEAKLDELLLRTNPNADVIEDIRKRVNAAIDTTRTPKPKR